MKCGFDGNCSDHISEFLPFAINFNEDRAYLLKPSAYLIDTITDNKPYCKLGIEGTT